VPAPDTFTPMMRTRRHASTSWIYPLLTIAVTICAVIASGCSSTSKGAPKPADPGSTARSSSSTTTVRTPPSSTHATPASQRREPGLPFAIQEAAAAAVGDRLFVVGGYDTQRNSSDVVFVFDGSTWHTGPALPIKVNHPGAAALGGEVFVAGGFTPGGGASNRVFALAPGASTWREVAPLRQGRGALALLSEGERLYAIGGRDRSTEIAVPEVYNPQTNSWSDLPAMPAPRNHLAGYIDGTLLCVAGGRTPATSSGIDCFDPATSAWHSRGTLPTGTSGAAGAVLGGATVVAGGEPAGETRVVDLVQTLRSQAWTNESMLVARHGTAYAIYRSRLWLCGGATSAGFAAVATCTSLG
jgi:hypothetical protein